MGTWDDAKKCGAKRKPRLGDTDGVQYYCDLPAGFGTEHTGFGTCKYHGGSMPMNVRHAMREMVEAGAIRTLQELGYVEPIRDPLTELSKITGEVVAWKNICRDRVQQMHEDEWRYEDAKRGEQIRAELLLWERALDRCERFLVSMARLKIDERLARIEEKQAQTVIDAVQATMRDMGLTLEQQENARKMLAGHLKAIA